MGNIENERIAEIIKENEAIMMDYVSDLTKRLEEKSITIDGIEQIMLQTFAAIRRGFIAATEEIISEEGKKKIEAGIHEKCGKKMIVNSNDSKITVNSLMGYMDIHRYLLFCRRCKEGYAPFDEALDINEEHKITKGLTEVVCDFAQRMGSFDEASYMLEKYLGIKISASMIQEVSEKTGKELYEKEKNEAEELYENQYIAISQVPENEKTGRIYIEADGSMLLIRGEGWKEIKLGIIFRDNKILNKDKERHIIIEKDYVASLGGVVEFKKMLWSAAVKNGFQNVKEVVIIGDGSEWIWNIARELFPEAVFILDYYHFEEHVYECANAIYPEDEVGRKRWADGIISRFMITDEIDEAIDSLRPEDFNIEEVKIKISGLKTYLENNKNKMHYKRYTDAGYYLGSGAVEGGHKHVIQQRLKLAGMRWSRSGAQYIATLRTASKSNKWNKVTEIIYGKAC